MFLSVFGWYIPSRSFDGTTVLTVLKACHPRTRAGFSLFIHSALYQQQSSYTPGARICNPHFNGAIWPTILLEQARHDFRQARVVVVIIIPLSSALLRCSAFRASQIHDHHSILANKLSNRHDQLPPVVVVGRTSNAAIPLVKCGIWWAAEISSQPRSKKSENYDKGPGKQRANLQNCHRIARP